MTQPALITADDSQDTAMDELEEVLKQMLSTIKQECRACQSNPDAKPTCEQCGHDDYFGWLIY